MQDYTLSKKSRKKFITDIVFTSENEFTVLFADGSSFPGVANTPENIEKVRRYQEKQAQRGVGRIGTFKRRADLSAVASLLTATGGFIAAHYASAVPFFQQHDLASGLFFTGATILAAAPSVLRCFKNEQIIKELEKIQYRDEHQEQLYAIADYPNTLSKVRNRRYFEYCLENGEDPYSVLTVDSYTKEDLETIVENVDRERGFQFVYRNNSTK